MHSRGDFDLLIVGGGINGAGIARDAAGRGLRVLLVEQGDLGSATSSASSKLIHGGLRYLEQYQFRLVAEALAEREVLLRCAPHLVHPMRFVMPHAPELRPAWLIRAGLFLYDYLARRDTLPASHEADLAASPYGRGLKPGLKKGFVYADCWVDDARLVVLTARDAADRGAVIRVRTACTRVRQQGTCWYATLIDARGAKENVSAAALVNATGPWARTFLHDIARQPAPFALKLVKGSHIVVPRLYPGNHAYILQNDDRRVVFAYSYREVFTLIGTTDVEMQDDPGCCAVSGDEIDYLCRAANRYFTQQVGPADVVWSYCGVRPLYDDGAANPSEVTRDYMLRIDSTEEGPPLLSVLGGKITTYRRLAEHALALLNPWFRDLAAPWTAAAPLPGGALDGTDLETFVADKLCTEFPTISKAILTGLAQRHGTNARQVLAGARGVAELGAHFGADLFAREIDYFIAREWACTADDVLWRRTKAGLHLGPEQRQAVAAYVAAANAAPMR